MATVSWYALVRALKDAVQQVIALDTAFTRLKMVTQAPDEQLAQMKDTYISLAKEMKVGLSTITDAAETWLRTGMSAADATEALQASTVLSKDAFMEGADAASVLVAAQKAYRLEAEDLMSVVDKLTTLDTKAATTAKDLGEALALSGASASAAGFSMDKYLAILATSSEVTQQSSSVIGNAWKTLTARLRKVGVGAKLDDEGEDISDVDKVLKNYGINLREVTNGLSNMENVVELLGKRWQTFTAEQKAQIATAVAGTRQQNIFIATMENYDRVLQLTEESLGSAGTALDKFGAHQDSVEAKIENLKTSWIALADATINSDMVKFLVDLGTKFLDFATKAGGLIPVIMELAGALIFLKSAVSGNVIGMIAGTAAFGGGFISQIISSESSARIEKMEEEVKGTETIIETNEKLSSSINDTIGEYIHLQTISEKTEEQTEELIKTQSTLAKLYGVSSETLADYTNVLDGYSEAQRNAKNAEIVAVEEQIKNLEGKLSEAQAKTGQAIIGGAGTDVIMNIVYSLIQSKRSREAQKEVDAYSAKIEELRNQLKQLKLEVGDLDLLSGTIFEGILSGGAWERSEAGARAMAETLSRLEKEAENLGSDALKQSVLSILKGIREEVEIFQSTDFVLTEYYDKQLEALQEQKELEDELAKQKEEQQKIADAELKVQDALLDVEKKRAALAEAREKRIQVFRMGKGMVYEEDTSAISSAQDDLSKSLDNYQDAMENLAKVQESQTEALISAVENLQKAYGLALLGDEEGKARKFFQTKENLEWYKGLSQEEQLAALMQFMTPENQAKAQALWSLDEELINKVGEQIRSGVFGAGGGGASGAGRYLENYGGGGQPTDGGGSSMPSVTNGWKSYKEAADAGYGNIAGASESERSRVKAWKNPYTGEKYKDYQEYLDAMYLQYVEGKKPTYHTGGIVGQPAFNSDTEMYAKLLKGEIVLPQNKFNNIIEKVKQSSSSQSTVLNIGNISLPNVDDADSFINELQKISYAKA